MTIRDVIIIEESVVVGFEEAASRNAGAEAFHVSKIEVFEFLAMKLEVFLEVFIFLKTTTGSAASKVIVIV